MRPSALRTALSIPHLVNLFLAPLLCESSVPDHKLLRVVFGLNQSCVFAPIQVIHIDNLAYTVGLFLKSLVDSLLLFLSAVLLDPSIKGLSIELIHIVIHAVCFKLHSKNLVSDVSPDFLVKVSHHRNLVRRHRSETAISRFLVS